MNSIPFHLSISGEVDTELDREYAENLLRGNLDAAVSTITGEGLITGNDPMEVACYSSVVNAGPNAVYDGLREAANKARIAGYAVVIFNPDELQGVEPRLLQNRLAELGNEAIEDLKDTDHADH